MLTLCCGWMRLTLNVSHRQICAYIPKLTPNSTDEDKELFAAVKLKQQHNCRVLGCLQNNQCKYGFPFALHPEHEACINPEARRWEYCRPCAEDIWTVPYHAKVLKYWGAHMNLQRVTGSDLSFYLLKYTMKSECIGKLDLDSGAFKRLGLDHLPEAEKQLINALVLAKPVDPAEAYCIITKQHLVKFSHGITKVNSAPPGQRTRAKGFRHVHSTEIYRQRSELAEDMTFCEFYRKHQACTSFDKDPEGGTLVDEIAGKRIFEVPDLIVRFTNCHPTHKH